jgi:uncharacterized protein YggE
MTDTPTVAVRGTVSRQVEPELAQLSITVAARDKDRQATLARLAQRVDALKVVLDRYADEIDSRETSGLYVHPEVKGSREKVTAYAGSVTTTVTFKDFSQLGDAVLTLADQDQVSVTGPYWSLRPDSPAYKEARRAAIDDALDRAHEYAQALGARVLSMVELADAGMAGEPAPIQPLGFAMRSATAMDQPQLDLEPQQQTVYAAVDARFRISEPEIER